MFWMTLGTSLAGLVAAASIETAQAGPTVEWISPASPSSSYVGSTSIPLEVDVGATANIDQVEFFDGGSSLGQVDQAPFRLVWSSPSLGLHELTAIATDTQGMRGTSSPVEVTIVSTVTVIAWGSEWAYWDLGELLNPNWKNLNYNDGAWARGTAPLGYGGVEETPVGYGDDENSKYITTYFRRTFQVTDPSFISQLAVGLLVDDGAIVYLNGVEVQRDNLPRNEVGYSTLATMNGTVHLRSVSIDPALLQEGENVLAVEVHQASWESEDLLFDLELAQAGSSFAISRGPYLQRGTPTGLVVRWRTDIPATSRVQVGTTAGTWTHSFENAALTTEHVVVVEGLQPDTRYYYSVGSLLRVLGEGPDYFFVTAPLTAKPTRIWILGDSGTADDRPRAVRDAYKEFTGQRHTDLWLMLGDNAYSTGTDPQYQAAVYDMFPEMLRKSVLWPTIGNHDTAFSSSPPPDLPYFNMFTLPEKGEAGGVPSGTEKYYSFDYGDIHFVCLDSMSSDRSSNGVMCTWLRADLEMNTRTWLIAFWHHPPYTKGSHDSDSEGDLVQVRQQIVPILERYGVDLVLTGHSHIYERSYLLYGHYGYSTDLTQSMVLDGGDGNPGSNGSYKKPEGGPNLGTVYAVAGSSGQATFRTGMHPAMLLSLLELGSLVLDVNGLKLTATFLRANGTVGDQFEISKDSIDQLPFRITRYSVKNGVVTLAWNAEEGKFYSVQAATNSLLTDWFFVSGAEKAISPTMSRSFPAFPGPTRAAFRVLNSQDD